MRLLKQELDADGIVSKCWISSTGRSWGGKPLGRGALYTMLKNRIYRGEIFHQGQAHPGEHQPIIDEPLWEAVQIRLTANTVEGRSGERMGIPSLLAGLIFDGNTFPAR